MACDSHRHGASYRWIHKQKRLHAQHGPIDLIIEADGELSERVLAFEQATAFFDTALEGLVEELASLRTPVSDLTHATFQSSIATHMHTCVSKFAGVFVTPMAAVAGSVADKTLAALCDQRKLPRAFVNNGGDIAVHLQPNHEYTIGICDNPITGHQSASSQIGYTSGIRGIASSGWQGRSHSLGIADAVTVLAKNAALADTAATLIANLVDLPNSKKISRVAANEIDPNSDLGTQLVTQDVRNLTAEEKRQALCHAQHYAQSLVAQGLISSAYLCVQGEHELIGIKQQIQWRHSA